MHISDLYLDARVALAEQDKIKKKYLPVTGKVCFPVTDPINKV